MYHWNTPMGPAISAFREEATKLNRVLYVQVKVLVKGVTLSMTWNEPLPPWYSGWSSVIDHTAAN